MAKKILRIQRVVYLTGLSKSTIYELIKKGEFPAQLKLSERASGWTESSINAWIDSRQKVGTGHE